MTGKDDLGYYEFMSQTLSVGEASSTAPGNADHAGNEAGSAISQEAESGLFAVSFEPVAHDTAHEMRVCLCDFPHCLNIASGYCKMHRIWLEAI